MRKFRLVGVLMILLSCMGAFAEMTDNTVVHGNVRVQLLNNVLIRLEQKGAVGFEDRPTFTVVNRAVEKVAFTVEDQADAKVIVTEHLVIRIPSAKGLAGTAVTSKDGTLLYQYNGSLPENTFLPSPAALPDVYLMADTPRLVPPAWGATPPPEGQNSATSGWIVDNNAPDIYLFLPKQGGYDRFKKDFLRLTGPIAMPPLYSFGLIHSRYFAYNEETALKVVDTYREKNIPIDVLVIDTDWRVGASHGYAENKKLFPDMKRFMQRAHAKNVKVMFNDHPEPHAEGALNPDEFQYRWEGLTAQFAHGLDAWWYDRNWHTHLEEPLGLAKEVWGMAVFWDITQRYFPERRPLIMSNIHGISSGYRKGPSHPAAHRYPIWWTGDTDSDWKGLQAGIENGVNCGVDYLLPYVNEDLGGHTGDNTPEYYTRFMQYGALSPATRPHCTQGLTRDPWAYGEKAEAIVRDYVQLRYRLMPVIYEASRKAYEDGTPMLRRCDLYWPEYKNAADSTQYLLGEDLLVAPVFSGSMAKVSGALLHTADGRPGLTAEYFDNPSLKGAPALVRTDKALDFRWKNGAPFEGFRSDKFSVRWNGTFGPVKESGEYTFFAKADDGCRIWLDGKLLIDAWKYSPALHSAGMLLEKGQTYELKIEYFDDIGGAKFCLMSGLASEIAKECRSVWIPEGKWVDLWSGEVIEGPQTIITKSSLAHTPMFVRQGSVVLSIPTMQHTGESPWDNVVVDAYVSEEDGMQARRLYEDDGRSNGYQSDVCAVTAISLETIHRKHRLTIDPMRGRYDGSLKQRSWTVRLHLPHGIQVEALKVDGKVASLHNNADVRILSAGTGSVSMPLLGAGASDGEKSGQIVELTLKTRPVHSRVMIELDTK